jgi:hypothetical protein
MGHIPLHSTETNDEKLDERGRHDHVYSHAGRDESQMAKR